MSVRSLFTGWLGNQASLDGGHRDAAVILDRSSSMATCDMPPNRMEAAKRGAYQYVKRLRELESSARVAVVSFADHSRLGCPLSPLEQHVFSAIGGVQPSGRTNMAAALRTAHAALKSSTRPRQAILLSDGHHNCWGDPLKAADKLRCIATVYCIGVGQREQVDENLLRTIASRNDEGEPLYRWIGDDAAELEAHFRRLAGGLSRT